MIEKLHKGGEIMITKAEEKSGSSHRNGGYHNGDSSSSEKKNGINTNLQRYSLCVLIYFQFFFLFFFL